MAWRGKNHLQLNATKTKELVLDFRKCKSSPIRVTIKGSVVDIVESNTCLGYHIDIRMDWSINTAVVYSASAD